MFLRRIKTFSFLLLITKIYYVAGTERIIECLNHSQQGDTNDTNLVHIVATGSEDTIHFLWSSYRLPSIIIARTEHHVNLSINFTQLSLFDKDAITFSEKPIESVGLTIKELWLYTDEKDMANFDHTYNATSLNLEEFKWSNIFSSLQCSNISATTKVQASSNESIFHENGTFGLEFSVIPKKISSTNFPHLFFTGNSSEIKVILNNFYSEVKETRYALTLLAFSSYKDDEWKKDTSKSITDEYSPGVFKNIDLLSTCCEGNLSSFLNWRPVAYTGIVPIVANSSDAKMSDFYRTTSTNILSIAELFFSQQPITFNMSFGTVGDDFYTKTKYTTWILMIGTGQPVIRQMSLSAIVFTAVGLGSLVLFMLIGALYTACEYLRKKDDDLLLSDDSIN